MSSREYIECPPLNFATNVLTNGIAVFGNLLVYGFTVYNTNASAQYLTVHDRSAVPGNGAVPAFTLVLPAHNSVGVYYGERGRHFASGLALANSSTDATLTIGSADCFFDVQYDLVD